MRNFEFMGPKYDEALTRDFLFGKLTSYQKKELVYQEIKKYINSNLPKAKRLPDLDNICVQEMIEYMDAVNHSNAPLIKENVLNTIVRTMENIINLPITFIIRRGSDKVEFVSDRVGFVDQIIFSRDSNLSDISVELCDMMDIKFPEKPLCRER